MEEFSHGLLSDTGSFSKLLPVDLPDVLETHTFHTTGSRNAGRPNQFAEERLWLPLRYLSFSEVIQFSMANKIVRHTALGNLIWYRLSIARWNIRPTKLRGDDEKNWFGLYREWHEAGRLPTGLLSGVSDVVLASSLRNDLCVWLCPPRGDTRLPHGLLRLPTEEPLEHAPAVLSVWTPFSTRSSVSSAESSDSSRRELSAPLRTRFTGLQESGGVATTPVSLIPAVGLELGHVHKSDLLVCSHPSDLPLQHALDCHSQYLLLKLVVQNLSSAGRSIFVSASDMSLILRNLDTRSKGDADIHLYSDSPVGAPIVLPACVPVGHDAVVAVNGVTPTVHADTVAIEPGGFAVMRIAFVVPTWRAGDILSEPEALEHVSGLSLRMSTVQSFRRMSPEDLLAHVRGTGVIRERNEPINIGLALGEVWRHYRFAGRGVFLRVE